ncbi:MAG: hypothetical protein ACQEQX_07610 [Thermodesulfobacteriota bacterium]
MTGQLESKDSLAWQADAAFRKSAWRVIKRAKFYGTPIVIWEDGQVKEVPAEEMEARLKKKFEAEGWEAEG